MALDQLVLDVLESFKVVRLQPFKENPWRKWFDAKVMEEFVNLEAASGLEVTAASGEGGWPEVPWIGFKDNRVAKSWNNGLYVAILFNADQSGISLSLQQGMDEMRSVLGMRKSRPILSNRSDRILKIQKMPLRFATTKIELRALERRGRMYEAAHVCGRSYARSEISVGLASDVDQFLELYKKLASRPEIPKIIGRSSVVDASLGIDAAASILDEVAFEKKFHLFIKKLTQDAMDPKPLTGKKVPKRLTFVARRIGQQALKNALLQVYDPICAACGSSVRIPIPKTKKYRYSLHAAHVVGLEFGGLTHVSNGILLCPNHHWAFDNHCWWLRDDHTISVADGLKEQLLLANIDGRSLPPPKFPAATLRPEAIKWHRDRAIKISGLAPG